MFPYFLCPYLPNNLPVNSISFAKGGIGLARCKNCLYNFFGKFCRMVVFTFWYTFWMIFKAKSRIFETSFFNAILRIVLMRAQKKVLGIAASRIITGMQHEKSLRNRTDETLVRKAVQQNPTFMFASNPNISRVRRLTFSVPTAFFFDRDMLALTICATIFAGTTAHKLVTTLNTGL